MNEWLITLPILKTQWHMERLTNAAPPTYSQVVENAPPPYQPTNAAILPEAKSSPTVLMAPRTSAPVVTVTRLPRAQVQDLKQCCARCCGVYCSILLFFLPRHYHC